MPLLTDQNLTVITIKEVTEKDVLGDGCDNPETVIVQSGTVAEVLQWSYSNPSILVSFSNDDVLVDRFQPLMTWVWLPKRFFFEEDK